MAEIRPPLSLIPDALLAAPLLTTKLYVPHAASRLVLRPRLMAKLNEGMSCKLALISAPAGFGKTTLLSEWVHVRRGEESSSSQVGWLSLDEGDNDPVRFWSYFIAALQTVRERAGAASLALLSSPQPPPMVSALTTLINEVAAIPGDLALVIDDYHLITTQAIHDGIAYLLDHLPPQMHLIIASRADLPLALARLRARGQLVELRADDLRFTLEEATAFLNQVLPAALSAEDIATLTSRTEGWIAGLQLAVLSLKDRADASRFIQSFAGNDRYILEYLLEEVLQRQPESVYRFLLETSLLDRLSGPLCDAVTERSDSQAMLEALEAGNLFIIALDSQKRWYRYHRLFADLLRLRLSQTGPERVAELNRQAGQWYEQNNMAHKAVAHALAADDPAWAARLIEQIVRKEPALTQATTLLKWLQGLPEDLVCSRPLLSIAYTWALLGTNQPEAMEAHLQHAEAALAVGSSEDSDAERQHWLGHVDALRAQAACSLGNFEHAKQLARQALERLPQDDLAARSVVALSLGDAYALSRSADTDAVEAARAFGEAIAISRAAGNTGLALSAMTRLAGLQTRSGRLHEAAETYRQALKLAEEQGGRPLPSLGEVHVFLGELLREWNDLDGAAQHLAEGIRLCKQGGRLVDLVRGYIFLSRVKQGLGDKNGAQVTIYKAKLLADSALETSRGQQPENHTLVWLVNHVAENQALLCLAQGNLEAAAQWAQERGLKAEDHVAYAGGGATLARLLIAQGRPEQALRLLAYLQSELEATGQVWGLIQVRILQALALQAQGESGQGLAMLQRALALAEPGGFIRILVDKGQPMAKLLRLALGHGIAPGYVSKLLAALGGAPQSKVSKMLIEEVLAERLSERELEVLRMMAAGFSNQEIADQLIVAIGTVKKHSHNIYGKLGVNSRTQAILRARELKLLPA